MTAARGGDPGADERRAAGDDGGHQRGRGERFCAGLGPRGKQRGLVVLSGRDFLAVLDDFYAFSPYGTTGVFVG